MAFLLWLQLSSLMLLIGAEVNSEVLKAAGEHPRQQGRELPQEAAKSSAKAASGKVIELPARSESYAQPEDQPRAQSAGKFYEILGGVLMGLLWFAQPGKSAGSPHVCAKRPDGKSTRTAESDTYRRVA
jgi:hypothetical protein